MNIQENRSDGVASNRCLLYDERGQRDRWRLSLAPVAGTIPSARTWRQSLASVADDDV